MNTRITTLTWAALIFVVWLVPLAVAAQTPREQAEKELAREAPNAGVEACSLFTLADVIAATGRDPYVEPEPAGKGGWICNFGTGELKVYSGPKSWEAWESTLKGFKLDKEPRTPAPDFGEQAYFFYPKPANEFQNNVVVLVSKTGIHTLVLSLDAPAGQPAESVRPAVESLMKTILARLP
jgi:hypothetical protein